MQIDLDPDVVEVITRRAERYGFSSPEEYASVIVTAAVRELESDEPIDDELETRLEDLGYL